MNRRRSDELDATIRRAWPVTGEESGGTSGAGERIRALTDTRIAEAGPHPDTVSAPRRSPTVGSARGRPGRVATVLVGVVLLVSVLGAGRLIMIRVQDHRGVQVDLAGDPTARVRAAVTATRRARSDLSVRSVRNVWAAPHGASMAVDELVARTDPIQTMTTVIAATGDWSVQTTVGPTAGMDWRQIRGEWYTRMSAGQPWEHVVPGLGRRPGQPDGGDRVPADAYAAVAALERYDGGWTATSDGSAGMTRYDAADADRALGLARELTATPTANGGGTADGAAQPLTSAVRLWIDEDTGRLRRIVAELRPTAAAAATAPPDGRWVVRVDAALRYGRPPAIEVPRPVTDVPFDEWCSRNRITNCDELRP